MEKNNIPKEIIDEYLAPGYSAFETGVKQLPTGELMLANLVPAPYLTGAMFDWWFHEFLEDTSQYQMWHKDHAAMEVGNRVRPDSVIGASHLSTEKLGDQVVPMQIAFFDPLDIFTPEQLAEARVSGGVCAEIISEGHRLGMLMHLIRDTFYGADIRTRVFLEIGDMQMALDTNKHNIEEMVHLAQFLPGLYNMYHED